MPRPPFILAFLVCICSALGTALECWFEEWPGNRRKMNNGLATALGEVRTLFAEYFFTKADVYFLSGCYSSIHDDESGAQRDTNWIAMFGINFRPTRHTHLGEDGHAEDVREILPWLHLAIETDPHHIDSYLAGAFILRKTLRQFGAAKSLLREGLMANSNDPTLLFELGHVFYSESGHEKVAAAIWTRALEEVERDQSMSYPTKRDLRRKIVTYLDSLEPSQKEAASVRLDSLRGSSKESL